MISPRLLLAFFNLGIVGFAHADTASQPSAPAPEANGHRRGSAIVAALDTNRDGVLSAAEIANAAVTLQALDTNGDGVLSVAELRGELPPARRVAATEATSRPARAPRPGIGFTLAFTLDANHDGEVQMLEVANAASSLRTLDLNRDGQLTPDELRFDLPSRTTVLAAVN